MKIDDCWNGFVFSGLPQDGNRTEQARVQKRGRFGDHVESESVVGHGDSLLLGEVEIADDAVGPQVDDIDLQLIARRSDGVGDVDAPGRRPQDAQRSAVQPDFGRFASNLLKN